MVIFYGNLYVFISYGTERIFPFDEIYMFLFHMSVGAEQAREVVTLVTSEAPCGLQWVET